MSEREIIARIRAGDEAGAEELLKRFGPLMRYLIAPILPDARDREECLDDVVLAVWEKIGSYDEGRGSFTAWLTAVARNAALSRARKLRNDGPAADGDAPDGEVSPEPTPEEKVLEDERRRALMDAIGRLPKGDRALFWRKYYYCQSTAQIAAETGITERAAEGRLYRIRKKLRKQLGGEDDD